jgi:hypothetical protein
MSTSQEWRRVEMSRNGSRRAELEKRGMAWKKAGLGLKPEVQGPKNGRAIRC